MIGPVVVKENKRPLTENSAIDCVDQREYDHLKVLYDRIFGDLDDAAHFMSMGTPSYACTHQEVLDKLSNRVFELKNLLRDKRSETSNEA